MTVTREPPGPLPPLPGLLRIQSNWQTEGVNWSVVFHVLKAIASAWAGADIGTVLTQFGTGVATSLLPNYGSTTTNLENVGTDLSSTMGLAVSDGGAGSGTASGKTAPVPINCVLRVHYPSPIRYRGGRPGINLSGLDATDRMVGSSNMWNAAAARGYGNAISAILGDLTGILLSDGSHTTPGWVSYFTHGAFRPTPLFFPVSGSGLLEQQRICSRRRRLGKGVAGE